MIKREVRSLIKNLLPKYPQGSEYHEEVIDRAIEKAINQLYMDTFVRNPHSLQRYVKRFGNTTPLAVSGPHAVTGLYYTDYSTLGVDTKGSSIMPISFSDKASGVRRVSTKTQVGVKFYPMDQREMELVETGSYFKTVSAKNTTSANIRIGYIVTQDRVEYYGMTPAIATDGVRMDCIIGFSDYEEYDQILIPENTILLSRSSNATALGFVELTLMILGVIRPQETKDDNLTTIEQNKK